MTLAHIIRGRRAPAIVAGAVLLAAAAAAAIWYLDRGDAPPGADASDPELVALGAAVYEEHCASCHGRHLEGEPDWRRRRADGTLPAPPHDTTGHTWHHPDEHLFRMTREGPARWSARAIEARCRASPASSTTARSGRASPGSRAAGPADIREAQAKIDASTRN